MCDLQVSSLIEPALTKLSRSNDCTNGLFVGQCMRNACEDVVGVQLDIVNLRVLLHADGTILMAEKESDLQNSLNRLSVVTDRMELCINVSKTEV
ncbi:unnamed protein product [Timema podura]|uniref:Reverse transcriptase domain-containing protein n=1 Tax=Timema podura TaxID=61482 RepID=A0ABN7NG61_TIMPD|nr:unnamed protein product [Timema podura]